MGEIHLICGKICSGKTYYARELSRLENAVILSCDALMLSLYPPLLGENHDEVAQRVREYLHARALDILRTGTSVILDWGFWTCADREKTEAFYTEKGVIVRWHYMKTSDETLLERIRQRNAQVLAGEDKSYYVDEGLFEKMQNRFEEPDARTLRQNWKVISQ